MPMRIIVGLGVLRTWANIVFLVEWEEWYHWSSVIRFCVKPHERTEVRHACDMYEYSQWLSQTCLGRKVI